MKSTGKKKLISYKNGLFQGVGKRMVGKAERNFHLLFKTPLFKYYVLPSDFTLHYFKMVQHGGGRLRKTNQSKR